jgi:hypothetical protein
MVPMTPAEEINRLAARSALARYAADDYREAMRRELAQMAAFVGKPHPKPRPRPARQPRPARGPGRWRVVDGYLPGGRHRFVWVPARAAVTASAARQTAGWPVRHWPASAADGMAYDLSLTVRF